MNQFFTKRLNMKLFMKIIELFLNKFLLVLILILPFKSFSEDNKIGVFLGRILYQNLSMEDSLLLHIVKLKFTPLYNLVDPDSFLDVHSSKEKNSKLKIHTAHEFLQNFKNYGIKYFLFPSFNTYVLSGLRPDLNLSYKRSGKPLIVPNEYYRETFLEFEIKLLKYDSINEIREFTLKRDIKIDLTKADLFYYISELCDSISDTLSVNIRD